MRLYTQGVPNFIFDPLKLSEQEYFSETNDATIGFLRQVASVTTLAAATALLYWCPSDLVRL